MTELDKEKYYPNGSKRIFALEEPLVRTIHQYKQLTFPNINRDSSYIYVLHTYYRDFFIAVQQVSVLLGPEIPENETKIINQLFKRFEETINETERLVSYRERPNKKIYTDHNHWERTFKATWLKILRTHHIHQFNKIISKYNKIYINPFLEYMHTAKVRIKTQRESGFHILALSNNTQ